MSNVRHIQQRPVRRPGHRRATVRRRRLGWRGRLILAGAALILALVGWGILARQFAPTSNTDRTRFDAIVVLGDPADADGNPSPTQQERVTEAVHEYQRGVAPRLILTGGAVKNQFVEARVMARTAEAEGIPASAIFVEPEARNTMENACYAERILKAHGWRSAEVVSSASHLPRAGIIFSELPQESRPEWRAHAAPPLSPEPSAHLGGASTVETLKTVRYLIWARWTERCEP